MLGRISSLLLLLASLSAGPVRADEPAFVQLYHLLRITESVEILRDEGYGYAIESESALIGTEGRLAWTEGMRRIYEVEHLETIVRQGFAQALDGADLAALVTIFGSDAAQKAIGLETSARRAFLSPDVEDAARAAWRDDPEGGRHADAVRQFIEVNDLIDRNVAGALNSNYLFLRALSVGDADLSEDQILTEVWNEEASIRADTEEWLYGFLSLAYAPLEPDEMASYLEIWQTDDGRALNNALFVAFDAMFESVSEAIGMAAARMMSQEEL